jgi:hypothetical protein
MRLLGQVEARSEKTALAAIKALQVDFNGPELHFRLAAEDDWCRPSPG